MGDVIQFPDQRVRCIVCKRSVPPTHVCSEEDLTRAFVEGRLTLKQYAELEVQRATIEEATS